MLTRDKKLIFFTPVKVICTVGQKTAPFRQKEPIGYRAQPQAHLVSHKILMVAKVSNWPNKFKDRFRRSYIITAPILDCEKSLPIMCIQLVQYHNVTVRRTE